MYYIELKSIYMSDYVCSLGFVVCMYVRIFKFAIPMHSRAYRDSSVVISKSNEIKIRFKFYILVEVKI